MFLSDNGVTEKGATILVNTLSKLDRRSAGECRSGLPSARGCAAQVSDSSRAAAWMVWPGHGGDAEQADEAAGVRSDAARRAGEKDRMHVDLSLNPISHTLACNLAAIAATIVGARITGLV